jgi:hypothetical protein
MIDDSFLMLCGIALVLLISLCLFIDHGYTVYKIAECKATAIEQKMPYLEINEVCK